MAPNLLEDIQGSLSNHARSFLASGQTSSPVHFVEGLARRQALEVDLSLFYRTPSRTMPSLVDTISVHQTPI